MNTIRTSKITSKYIILHGFAISSPVSVLNVHIIHSLGASSHTETKNKIDCDTGKTIRLVYTLFTSYGYHNLTGSCEPIKFQYFSDSDSWHTPINCKNIHALLNNVWLVGHQGFLVWHFFCFFLTLYIHDKGFDGDWCLIGLTRWGTYDEQDAP